MINYLAFKVNLSPLSGWCCCCSFDPIAVLDVYNASFLIDALFLSNSYSSYLRD